MVAIVSGNSLGLNLTSLNSLGQRGLLGAAGQGRNGELAYVNIANGNLVLQDQDDYLVSHGLGIATVRTYNSQGKLNDDNGDNWSVGAYLQRLSVTGTVNTAGSTVTRTGRDGSEVIYTYDSAKGAYLSNVTGVHDTITYVSADSQYEWRDSRTGVVERYGATGGGRLQLSRDPSGNTLTYAYNASGMLTSVVSASGETTYYDYTGTNLTQIRTINASGATSTHVRYTYDASSRLTSVVVDLSPDDNSVSDGKVYQTNYTYDGTSRRIASITQTDGTSLAFTYTQVGADYRVSSVTNALGQATSYSYNTSTRQTTVTDPLGLVTKYDYDTSGQLTKITAPAVSGVSQTNLFAYNATGDLTSVTDGEGRVVTYDYDARGNQILQRDAAGNTITRTFNAANQLIAQTTYLVPNPGGTGQPGTPQTTRYIYDAGSRNLVRFVITPEGRVTEYRYNGYGERTSAISYVGAAYSLSGLGVSDVPSEATMASWAASQNLAQTQRTDMVYDGRGQLQSATAYASVNASGVGVTDGTQSTTQYVYDQSGRLLQTVSATNGTTSYVYDGLGRVISATNALGQVTLSQYNDAGNKTTVTFANGLVTTSSYDSAGRLISVLQTNSASLNLGETKYFYDADNRLRMTQDPTGVRQWMLYDEAGRKVADVDATGTMTEYSYDKNNQLTYSITYGTAVSTSGLVDGTGQPVLTVTAASLRPTGNAAPDKRVWRAYDSANRLVRVAQAVGATDIASVTETKYDGASQVIAVVQYANTVALGSVAPGSIALPTTSSQDRTTRNFYDADGRLVGQLDAEGYLVQWRYDAAGRQTERIAYATATAAAQRASGTLAQLVPSSVAGDIRSVNLFNAKGQVIAVVDGEGYLTEMVYDGNGNVTQSIRYATRVTATVTTSSTLSSIRPASSSSDRSVQRTYDALNRVTQETSPEGVVTQYSYDNAGNLVSTVRAVGTTEVRTLLAKYDLQGRLIGELSAEGAAQLTGGQTQAQIDAVWAQYGLTHVYDAAGRRMSTTDANGNKTLFFYDADGRLTYTVNALGEVQERRYDAQGRLSATVAYLARISLTGLTGSLAGGLVNTTLTNAVAAVANATNDSKLTWTYTRDGQISNATDALGNATTYTYNAFGEAISSSQATGDGRFLVRTYTLDRRGLQTGVTTDASGINAITSAVYDAFGRLTRAIDARGNLLDRAYDRLGRVVSTVDALNATRFTTYDAFDRVLTQTDALGRVTSYAYDKAARSITVTTPEGIVTVTTYTRHGQVQSVSDGKGQVTQYAYDRNGNLLQTTTPLTTTSTAYDAAGRVIKTTDANGNQVTYAYDAANRVLTRKVDPNGLNLVTSYQYDGKGQQISVTDPQGIVTQTQYDRKGQVLKQIVDPTGLNLPTTYTYDGLGNTLTVLTPGGKATQYSYDVMGRRTQERVDPTGLNLTRSWTYDTNGNAVSSTDANGNVTRYAYDAANHLVFTLDPLGNLQQLSYDAQGRLVKSVAYATPISLTGLPAVPAVGDLQPRIVSQAAQDVVEHRVYDKDGRLTATVDGTGAVVSYTYDANGNVIDRRAYATRINMQTWVAGTAPAPVADATHDQRIQTLYDALNRATYSVDGTGAVVAWTYDANGNVAKRIAYATSIPTNTAMTQTAISAAVAAVANAARDASVRNVFDAANRQTWSADGTGAVTQFIYDKNGNLVRSVAYATAIAATAAPSSVTSNANDRTLSMAYDAANRLVFQIDALNAVTEQTYDGNGNVVRTLAYATALTSIPTLGTTGTVAAIRAALTVNSTYDRVIRYGYDAAGRQVIAIDPMGAVSERTLDAAGQVIAITRYATVSNTSGLSSTPTLAALKALIVTNAADRLTKQAYDTAGRLVYTVDATGAVTYNRYDGVGRLAQTTRYAKAIPATTANTAAGIATAVVAITAEDQTSLFSYNAAGQLIASTDALGNTESYTYDGLGRRLTFTNKRGFTWSYEYDAAGRQIQETSPQVDLTAVTASTSLGNDASGNPVVLNATNTTGVSIVTRLAYDALGQLTQRTEAYGRSEQRITKYEYDAAGRQVKITYPTVNVYNAAGDNLTTNGATGVASRTETSQTLQAQIFYDTLGNAVASRDVGGALSQKVYDRMGRVIYDIDALGYVSGYTRNVYGEVTSLVRYGSATTLANGTVTQASQAATKAQVDAALGAAGFSHASDRTLITSYDKAGRVSEVVEPVATVYDSSAAAALQMFSAGKTTRNTYNAFGDVVQVSQLRNSADTNSANYTWLKTTTYRDAMGREVATVDAMGYLTTKTYDSVGNLKSVKEYANALTAGSWTLASYGSTPTVSAYDRLVEYAYDRGNRKVSETRRNVEYSAASNGASATGDLITTYGYDALGNLTRTTDALGKATYSYYDALGRVTAVAAPSRNSTVSGGALIPLTVFRRDAYGNVVVKIDYANGAASATETAYTVGAANAADRINIAVYDSLGHSIQSTSANGAVQYSSYDAYGHVAKKWQGVTGNDGVTRTAFEAYQYDKLGHLTGALSPASTGVVQGAADNPSTAIVSQAQAGLVTMAMEYNAFGEMTRKGTQGGRQEYYDYDNAGRLWRTNSGDGVDRINLYDLQGNVTAEIRSSGAGRDNRDLKTFATAQAAAADLNTRRTDVVYDALGHITQTLQAARQVNDGGAVVRLGYVSATVAATATQVDNESGTTWTGNNTVNLSWSSLASLGSGDIKVYLEYRTPEIRKAVSDESGNLLTVSYSGSVARSYTSGIYMGDSVTAGVQLAWPETGQVGADGGIGKVTRVVLYKRDVLGNWQVVMDQQPGYGGSFIDVVAPADPQAVTTLELRVAGSSGNSGWWQAPLTNYGTSLRFDASSLALGNYEYRVKVKSVGDADFRTTATGTVGLAKPPLAAIGVPLAVVTPGSNPLGGFWDAGIMAWSTPGGGTEQIMRYRPAGSNGAWSMLNVVHQDDTHDGVDLRTMGAGTYEFELLWSNVGAGVPYAHATGQFAVMGGQPAHWVPAVNVPVITGVSIGTGNTGTYIGKDEGGNPLYVGGTTVPALVWDAAGATIARYRVANGVWNYLTIDNVAQGAADESGNPTGTQKALLNGFAPGTYEFEILTGSPATRQATGTFVIYGQSPGHYETQTVQVPIQQPVVIGYQPVYETRYATRWVPYSVWVNDPPRISGYTEFGAPIWEYPGHWDTGYREEWYSYVVQVGQTPVYATDESGRIIYQTVYVPQQQQVWVPGTTPNPAIASITTPPYTPGYTAPATPRQYAISVTTGGSTQAQSTVSGQNSSQGIVTNGGDRLLRPTVFQKTDRWGNVLEITDPRASYWKITYKYNANNQLVQETRPDVNGNQSGASPVTRYYYDALGRQVAVKDANGNVNGKVYDAAGNLVQELHADGGTVSYSYSAFGDKLRMVDALGRATTYQYDRMGHVLSLSQGGSVGVYRVNGSNVLEYVRTGAITQSWTYDQVGHLLSQTNGAGETIRYTYDLRGNVIETWQPLGQLTRAAYDAQNRKIGETDANGYTSTWTYDYFGALTAQRDIGGARYTYTYDNARQLVQQTNTRGQNLSYTYDAAGQVLSITDWANGKVSSYAYDLAGRRVRERTVQGGNAYQDNHLAYDAQGNLRDVSDARAHITMDYDAVGNRTHIYTSVGYQGINGEAASQTNRFYRYDQMNRQIVVDAVDAAGNIGTQGHQIIYDKNGNRTSDTYWGNRVAAVGGGQVITGYDESSGQAIYGTAPATYQRSDGLTTEQYRYDELDRLQSVQRDGVQVDLRQYDGAGRVVHSGPGGNLPQSYATLINQGLSPSQSNGLEIRLNRYDANGRLLHQKVLNSEGGAKYDLSYDNNELMRLDRGSGVFSDARAAGYDAAGNLQGYVIQTAGADGGAPYQSTYTTSLQRYEGYREGTTSGTSTLQQPGSSTQGYDANGYLVSVIDSTQVGNNRALINDAQGRVLFVNQAGNIRRQLVVNGEVLGLYGAAIDPVTPVVNTNQPWVGNVSNPNFANLADFNFGYAKISSGYPNASPGAYQVQRGDSLQSIAKSAYGDSSLWYTIAQANGLSSSRDLKVGQTLNIPSRVGTVSNNAGTFKPYEPGKAVGDTSPNLAAPQGGGDDDCGGLGQLIMAVVTVAVAIYAPQALGLIEAGVPAWASAMAGAAMGSLAGQVVGNALGVVDGINWKSVALAALSAGVTQGLVPDTMVAGSPIINAVVKAAVGNALTQGIAVATGLQSKFDWRGVAASAVGAGVGMAVSEGLGLTVNGQLNAALQGGQQLAARALSGLAGGLAAAAMRGGKIVVQQIATDAFGNVIGDALARGSISGGAASAKAGSDPLGDFIAGNQSAWDQRYANYQQVVGAFTQAAGASVDRSNDVQMAATGFNPKNLPGGFIDIGDGSGRMVAPNGDIVLMPDGTLPINISSSRAAPANVSGARNQDAAWIAVQNAASDRVSRASLDTPIRETVTPIYDADLWYPEGSSGGTVVGSTGSSSSVAAQSATNAYTTGDAIRDVAIGAAHAVVDTIVQPGMQVRDLSVAAAAVGYNELIHPFTGGQMLLPEMKSGIATAYAQGASQGKLLAGAVPVLNVGVSSYDTTTALMDGRYQDAARSAGGFLGSMAVGAGAQRYGNYSVGLRSSAPGTLNSNRFPLELRAPETLGGGASGLRAINLPDFVGPYPQGTGPVWVKAPPGATQAEINAVNAYIRAGNAAIEMDALSPTGRVSTKGALSTAASRQAAIERSRAAEAGTPYAPGEHVGHGPDTTWTDNPIPPFWVSLPGRVNTSIGGQANGYPTGYKPTIFLYQGP